MVCVRPELEEKQWRFVILSGMVRQSKENRWGKPHPTLSSLRKQGSLNGRGCLDSRFRGNDIFKYLTSEILFTNEDIG